MKERDEHRREITQMRRDTSDMQGKIKQQDEHIDHIRYSSIAANSQAALDSGRAPVDVQVSESQENSLPYVYAYVGQRQLPSRPRQEPLNQPDRTQQLTSSPDEDSEFKIELISSKKRTTGVHLNQVASIKEINSSS